MPVILEVENLVKKFGDFEAVKGVSFAVEQGEVFGLLGPNGADKTTTISMLTGILPPTSGTARIAFQMPLGREPLGLVLLTIILGLVASALGMLVASFASSSKQADSVGTILGFVLGRAIAINQFPLTRSGGPMAIIAQLTPHSHAIEAFYRLMAEQPACWMCSHSWLCCSA
jgi:energy-coupling factor transporter ATP-binding protein EcfA2